MFIQMGPTPVWHLAQGPIHFPISPYFAVHFCCNKRKRNENHSSAININFDHESDKNPKCIHFVVFIPHFLQESKKHVHLRFCQQPLLIK